MYKQIYVLGDWYHISKLVMLNMYISISNNSITKTINHFRHYWIFARPNHARNTYVLQIHVNNNIYISYVKYVPISNNSIAKSIKLRHHWIYIIKPLRGYSNGSNFNNAFSVKQITVESIIRIANRLIVTAAPNPFSLKDHNRNSNRRL